jgi:heptosyltransferase III
MLIRKENRLNKRIPKRVLVFRIGQFGDTIVGLPAYWVIREKFPDAHLALLRDSHKGKNYVTPEKVLPAQGLFDEYISYFGSEGGTKLREGIKLVLKLRRLHFDTIVYLYPSGRKLWRIWLDLFFFHCAGIHNFIGTRGISSEERLSARSPLPTAEHESDYLLRRLSKSGIPVPAQYQGKMNLGLTQSEIEKAKAWIVQKLAKENCRNLIALGPGSKMPSRIWPEDRYAELVCSLIEEFEIFPIIFGGPEDRPTGDRLLSRWGRGANSAGGELSIREEAALISQCKLYVGNNSGNMHLAAAVKTPCVAIFSASEFPGKWNPYGGNHIVLRKRVPCEGCKLQICDKNMECLALITTESAVQECRSILKGIRVR